MMHLRDEEDLQEQTKDREILVFEEPEHLLHGIFPLYVLSPHRKDELVLPR